MPTKDLKPAPTTPLVPLQQGFNRGVLACATAVMALRAEYLTAPTRSWSGQQVASMLERLSLAFGDAYIAEPGKLTV